MKKIILVFLAALTLAGCYAVSPQTDPTSFQLPPNVEITFNVLAPENSPAGEGMLFTILDEVTGLEYNPQRQPMETSGERSYAITLSVPAGTLLKYRYTRQAVSGLVEELNALGQPIAYREYWVDGPGHVANDLIAAWGDAPSQQASGQVGGTITDAGGHPLANLAINASGIQTSSDTEGRFVLAGLPQGLHNIVVTAPDGSYLPFQQGALVAAGSDTQANIQVAGTIFASVTFNLKPITESAAAVPTYFTGNLTQFASKPQLSLQADGSYTLTLQLPTGVDIRYKYTLGDGFWNAEHNSDGSFVLRQLIIPLGTTELTVDDQVAAWTSGTSAPVWFDLTAPATTGTVYLQFKFIDWVTPLPMWSLGNGRFAYILYSPTNFAAALEYRYCLDAACTLLEAIPGQPRSVIGNPASLQKIEDSVDAWQAQ